MVPAILWEDSIKVWCCGPQMGPQESNCHCGSEGGAGR
ncbi:hypothetical protein A6R68_13959 [Neotoma lepida]|uniref:Uncharacterized protein n=1 Tax=Neotoma lepida TaxID=56216 RepID=A0A1A6GZP8_NEOLE|nr:hypothetical protein A6R68_13959 [Neotoma lepida]